MEIWGIHRLQCVCWQQLYHWYCDQLVTRPGKGGRDSTTLEHLSYCGQLNSPVMQRQTDNCLWPHKNSQCNKLCRSPEVVLLICSPCCKYSQQLHSRCLLVLFSLMTSPVILFPKLGMWFFFICVGWLFVVGCFRRQYLPDSWQHWLGCTSCLLCLSQHYDKYVIRSGNSGGFINNLRQLLI